MRTYSLFGWDKMGRLGQPRFYSVSAWPNSEQRHLGHSGQTRSAAIFVPSVPTRRKLTWDTSDPRIYSSVPSVPTAPKGDEGMPWAEWKAATLNGFSHEQGVTQQPDLTVRHGERKAFPFSEAGMAVTI